MLTSINFTEQTDITTSFGTVRSKVAEWSGRGIAWISATVEQAMPHLQDKRIAVVSLVALNLILIEISELFTRLCTSYMPKETETHMAFQNVFRNGVGLTVQVLGVVAFSRFARLPLSPLAIAGISVVTFYASAPLLDR